MKILLPIILGCICLLYACQEPIDFSEFEDKNVIVLNNPIRFDQLAIGQNSTYVSIRPDSCYTPACCQQSLDTLRVEIIEKDTNGYLLKEVLNKKEAKTFFFYLKYENILVLKDMVENEPAVKEYDELIAIKTKPINEDPINRRSSLFRRLGAKFYLNTTSRTPLINMEIENICEVLFLPDREDDPLPYTDHITIQHSKLGIIQNYSFEDDCYGDLLLTTHDYGYVVDGFSYSFGYTWTHGIVFSGAFRGAYLYGDPQVWHLVPNP